MTNITFAYKGNLSSEDFNQRFADFMNPGVHEGFKIVQGSEPFSLHITSDTNKSVLIAPDGTRVEETQTLFDIFSLNANTTEEVRTDYLYCIVKHEATGSTVEYTVVEDYAEIPFNAVLLASVDVQPSSAPLAPEDVFPSDIEVAVKQKVPTAVSTLTRPEAPLPTGISTFDQTLGKPIWWNGTAWVDATGTTV